MSVRGKLVEIGFRRWGYGYVFYAVVESDRGRSVLDGLQAVGYVVNALRRAGAVKLVQLARRIPAGAQYEDELKRASRLAEAVASALGARFAIR